MHLIYFRRASALSLGLHQACGLGLESGSDILLDNGPLEVHAVLNNVRRHRAHRLSRGGKEAWMQLSEGNVRRFWLYLFVKARVLGL